MTAKDLETVQALQKSIEDLQGAIRKMAQENQNLLSMLSKVSEDASAAKAEITNLKTAMKVLEKKVSPTHGNVQRY